MFEINQWNSRHVLGLLGMLIGGWTVNPECKTAVALSRCIRLSHCREVFLAFLCFYTCIDSETRNYFSACALNRQTFNIKSLQHSQWIYISSVLSVSANRDRILRSCLD